MKKKRIWSLLLCICLVWTMMPAAAFAQEVELTGDTLRAYQAYEATKVALEADEKDLEALTEAFAVIYHGELNLEPEQLDQLPDDYLSVCSDARAVIDFAEKREEFLAWPSRETADDLVDFCTAAAEAGRMDVVKSFFQDYDAVLEDAGEYASSENAKTIYDAYTALKNALEFSHFTDSIAEELGNLKAVQTQDMYQNMTADDLEDLADLMGEDASNVKSVIEADVNAADFIVKFHADYIDVLEGEEENPQRDAEFVTAYETVVNSDTSSPRLKFFFAAFFEETYCSVLHSGLTPAAQQVHDVYKELVNVYVPGDGEYDVRRLNSALQFYDEAAIHHVAETDWPVLVQLLSEDSADTLKASYSGYISAAQGILAANDLYYDTDYWPAEGDEPESDGEDSGFDRAEGTAKTDFAKKFEAKYREVMAAERGFYIEDFLGEEFRTVTEYLQSLPKPAPVPYVPVSPVVAARAASAAAISSYADAADYDAEEAAAIQAIAAQAKKDINAAKTVEEVKRIEEAAMAEIDKLETAAEKVLIAEVEAVKFSAKSAKTTLNGKRAVKIRWTVPEGMDFDGYEVYRSTRRYSGFGTEPFFTTSKTQYINNKGLKKGETYYYKVRGFKFVNDEKVYTEHSFKAWRTILPE